MCATSTANMKVACASALLGRSDGSIYDLLQRFTEKLQKEDCQDFQEILQEGMLVSNQMIAASADTSDLSAHSYCYGISASLSAWLRLTGLKPEAQARIQNLPFSGSTRSHRFMKWGG